MRGGTENPQRAVHLHRRLGAFDPTTAHWGLRDPAALATAAREQAFLEALVTMKRRIGLTVALPISSLDRRTIQKDMKDIVSRCIVTVRVLVLGAQHVALRAATRDCQALRATTVEIGQG